MYLYGKTSKMIVIQFGYKIKIQQIVLIFMIVEQRRDRGFNLLTYKNPRKLSSSSSVFLRLIYD